MGHYTGPKAKINRRLGGMIYENRGAVRAADARPNPPGMHNRPRRPSNYGAALMEKQKIKHYYGLGEKQLRRYFDHAKHMKGNAGENLLTLCERRLDNVVRRAGLALTRPQARQGVVHGHFLVNGQKVDKPSYQLRPGDIVSVKSRENLQTLYRSISGEGASQPADFASYDGETLSVTMDGLPSKDDISLPVDVNIVVEFMSR
ncbi:MAG: 30S ribosomal protein S4 [Blastopirellula sp.]|nr:MAG: 30S ribosomal protein S4 [Blastopirellula sp.]